MMMGMADSKQKTFQTVEFKKVLQKVTLYAANQQDPPQVVRHKRQEVVCSPFSC